MGKIANFFSKWGFAIILCCFAVGLLFALGCSVYTAVTNLSVGLVGCATNGIILTVTIGWIFTEIKEGKTDAGA